MANQTDGNGYGILSPIAQNAIRVMRDKQLRPDAYAKSGGRIKGIDCRCDYSGSERYGY